MSKENIRLWFDVGVRKQATHMIVVADTFAWEDYPVYVGPVEDVRGIEKACRERSMQKVMEVYNLSMDREGQLRQHRVFNY